MDITITIPEDKKDALIEAFATTYKYQETITDEEGVEIPNPVSKGQFSLNIIKTFIKEVYISAQIKPIEDTKATAIETANTEIDVITVE